MESVSCHQKGLVMGNILWSVDKKIYSDKEDHTLAITGWAITRDQSECEFILYGSGKELSVPEPSRCERADVAKDLKEKMCIRDSHSTVQLWLSEFHKSTGKWWRSISSKRSDCG